MIGAMDVGVLLLIAWVSGCLGFSLHRWWMARRDERFTSQMEKLVMDRMPPMHGIESDDNGGWRKF